MTPRARNRFALLPITAAQANLGIARFHRHAGPVTGAKMAYAAWDRDRCGFAGCIVLGRPVSRILDDGVTLEVNRLAVDPEDTPNLCSQMMGTAARVVFKHRLACQLVTYTIAHGSETGASLRAAGWTLDVDEPLRPRRWNTRPGREASAVTPAPRLRWRKIAPWVLKRNATWSVNERDCATGPVRPESQGCGGARPAIEGTEKSHPALAMGSSAAISGARRDSNPFLRYPVKPALRTHLIDLWDQGWRSVRGLAA
tara:strand:- start:81 stop:848 length:768 start_codon:yes stop_codon:yes gene_type:complete